MARASTTPLPQVGAPDTILSKHNLLIDRVNDIDAEGTVFQDGSGSGVVVVTSLPAATSALRSLIYAVRGTTGVADVLYVCEKTELDTYAWIPLTPSAPQIVTQSLDWPSIPAGSTSELTVAVTGAQVGDEGVASPQSAPEAGLVWSAYVGTNGSVTVRMANVTVSAINPAARTWRVTYRSLA